MLTHARNKGASCLQSHAWSFACLACFARRRRETARSLIPSSPSNEKVMKFVMFFLIKFLTQILSAVLGATMTLNTFLFPWWAAPHFWHGHLVIKCQLLTNLDPTIGEESYAWKVGIKRIYPHCINIQIWITLWRESNENSSLYQCSP